MQNELAYFDVTLSNPFAFELDLPSVMLKTSGVPFEPVQTSIIVPPQTQAHTVRLSGLPLQPGQITLHGCQKNHNQQYMHSL